MAKGSMKAVAKAAQQRVVLAILHNRGHRRFATLKVISRKTRLSLATLRNYFHEWNDLGVCTSISVLSQDGTCAWGLCDGVEITPAGLGIVAVKKLKIGGEG